MHTLDDIMSPEEAGILWGCTGDHVRHLCQDGAILAKKIGKQWVVQKSQPNPLQRHKVRGCDEWKGKTTNATYP